MKPWQTPLNKTPNNNKREKKEQKETQVPTKRVEFRVCYKGALK
jgi:hypothetical protein